jgi:hypothetical protein
MSLITITSNRRVQLPAEMWCEIATCLSRPDWRTLLHVPHPLRRFALDFFFRDIFLQFDVYGYHPGDVGPKFGVKELEAWHSKRSLGIMTRILRDRSFANRVRTLKVLMCDHRESRLADVIDDLNIGEHIYTCQDFLPLTCRSLSKRSTAQNGRTEGTVSLRFADVSPRLGIAPA